MLGLVCAQERRWPGGGDTELAWGRRRGFDTWRGHWWARGGEGSLAVHFSLKPFWREVPARHPRPLQTLTSRRFGKGQVEGTPAAHSGCLAFAAGGVAALLVKSTGGRGGSAFPEIISKSFFYLFVCLFINSPE